MKNFKKAFLSLGTIGAIAAPIATVVSCGAEIAHNKDGQGVGWNRGDRKAYINIAETTSKEPFKAFIPVKGGSLESGFSALTVAQLWERAAGYATDAQYESENPQAVRKLHEGDIVTVNLAFARDYLERPDSLHATLQKRWKGFSVEYSFPFHEIKNMKNNDAEGNEALTPKLKTFYESYQPYGIHTNFLKALLVAFSSKTGFTIKEAGGVKTYLSKDSTGNITADNSNITGESGLPVWLTDISIKTAGEDLKGLEDIWGDGKKTLQLADALVN